MKKGIIAILILAILGMALIPNILTATATENLIIQLDNNYCEDAFITADDAGETNTTNYETSQSLGIGNITSGNAQFRTVIRTHTNFLANNTNISIVYLEFYDNDPQITNQNTANISIHELYDDFNESEVCWTNRTDYNTWRYNGSHFNSQPLDIIEIENGVAGWYQFNITEAYRNWTNNGTKNNGLLIKKYNDTIGQVYITFSSSEHTTTSQRPKLNITYTGGNNNPTGTSTITKDVWNLKGFVGESKNASTIYSEISNCTALSWKNATSGYWYTYWPEYGLLENENLVFGDGLFILTDENTTWDHT